MSDCEALRKYINEHDTFCKSNHMELTRVTEGHAEAVLTVDADKFNGAGTVQGGAIFTLADLAFAGAANSYGERRATSMSANIAYLRPGSGPRLYAVADVVNRGRRSCLVEIAVTDENAKLVAKVSVTGFFV